MSFWMTGGARRLKQKRRSDRFGSGSEPPRQRSRSSKVVNVDETVRNGDVPYYAALQQQQQQQQQQQRGNNDMTFQHADASAAAILGQHQQLLRNPQVGGAAGLSSNRGRESLIARTDLLDNETIKILLQRQLQQQQQLNFLNTSNVSSLIESALLGNHFNDSSRAIGCGTLPNSFQHQSLGLDNLNQVQQSLNLNFPNNNPSDAELLEEYRKLLGISNGSHNFTSHGSNSFNIPNSPTSAPFSSFSQSIQGKSNSFKNDLPELCNPFHHSRSLLRSAGLTLASSQTPSRIENNAVDLTSDKSQNIVDAVIELERRREILFSQQHQGTSSLPNDKPSLRAEQLVEKNSRINQNGTLHGLSRFQKRTHTDTENTSAGTNMQKDNSSSSEQRLRYFNDGVEVDVSGIPVRVSPKSSSNSSLSSLQHTATEQVSNHHSQNVGATGRKLQDNPFANTTIGELIHFVCTQIPEIDTLIRPLSSNDKLTVGHISTVLMEMNRIFDDKVLHVLSNDARIRILNCIRVIESLKRDLDNSVKSIPQPQCDDKSWTLFGKEIDGKRYLNQSTNKEGNDISGVNQKRKEQPESAASPKKRQKVKTPSSSTSMKVSPKTDLQGKRLSSSKKSKQKGISKSSKTSKVCGPHSVLLDEVFGTKGYRSSPKNKEKEVEMELNAAHALLNFAKP